MKRNKTSQRLEKGCKISRNEPNIRKKYSDLEYHTEWVKEGRNESSEDYAIAQPQETERVLL